MRLAFSLLSIIPSFVFGQLTPFELSDGKSSATYYQAISFYKSLAAKSGRIKVEGAGETDAPFPLNVVYVSNRNLKSIAQRDPRSVLILINNGIHAGEPDGIDACMMLTRDIAAGKLSLPDNVVLAIIPVYNIGGALNRNSTTRVNQNGPEEYGFRGNSNNYDLNRDFTKTDANESRSFAKLFTKLRPDIFLDNHVSDGADYQHVMTLITTQYDKLGGLLGNWLRERFDPALYTDMRMKGSAMIPYIDFESGDIRKAGITQFSDPPRYGSGYGALFGTISYVSETHMLKSYPVRVKATYDLMETIIRRASQYASQIKTLRTSREEATRIAAGFYLRFVPDSSKTSSFEFRGYEADTLISEVTGYNRIRYNHAKPFTENITYRNVYRGVNYRQKPAAYIIPAAQHEIIMRLKLNGVKMQPLTRDSVLKVVGYNITQYVGAKAPYEGRYRNNMTKFTRDTIEERFFRGDFIIPTGFVTDRYLVEMLEPDGDDSFFAWGFYNTYLQQKEGYSDYRWEDEAKSVLDNDKSLRAEFDARKSAGEFGTNTSAMLYWIYQHSKWREKEFMRYPVFRLERL